MSTGIPRSPAAQVLAESSAAAAGVDDLLSFLRTHRGLMVLSGAGCSTGSGIPDYRDLDGRWKHYRPVMHADFMRSESMRRRYWSRSMFGWPSFSRALPNDSHLALAHLQSCGCIGTLVTQNVDGLHQCAGSKPVIDLHGRLALVECQDCAALSERGAVQRRLEEMNRDWRATVGAPAPDGDVQLLDADYAGFCVPACDACGGILKPRVVFFGDSVPRPRVEAATRALTESPALLVVGSSLMVMSGYRFVRQAKAAGKPVAIIALGRTRGDPQASLRLWDDCATVLAPVARSLC